MAATRFDQDVRGTVAYILTQPQVRKLVPEFDAWCDRVVLAIAHAVAEVRGRG